MRKHHDTSASSFFAELLAGAGVTIGIWSVVILAAAYWLINLIR